MRWLMLPLTLMCGLAWLARADEGGVEVIVEQRQVAVDTQFLVTVRATGKRIGQMKLPGYAEGLEIDPSPRRNFSSTVISNGKMTTSLERSFLVRATRPGKVTLPPFGVEIDGVLQYSNALELTAVPSPQSPMLRPGEDRTPTRLTMRDLLFITTDVDKVDVYIGEPIQLTLSLWQMDLDEILVEANRAEVSAPSTEGFYTLPRTPQLVDRSTEIQGDRRYRVERYRQMLFPMKTGTLTIGAWKWTGSARFRSQYGLEHKELTLDAPALVVNVKALPPGPAEFSGAVGSFVLKGEVTAKEVVQGTPFELMIRVTGEGNPNAIGNPVVAKFEGAHVSDPKKSDTPIGGSQGMAIEKSFVYTVTPTRPGPLTIPEVRFVHFDPVAGQYKSAVVGPFEVNVLPSGKQTERVVVDASTPMEPIGIPSGGEMRPLVFDPGTLRPRGMSTPELAVLVALPPVAYLALSLFLRRRRKLIEDPRYARAVRAEARAIKRLDSVRESSEPSEALYRALSGYLADKFDVEESGMTSSDAARLLEANGVDSEVATGIVRILRACERARYGATDLGPDEAVALESGARTAIRRLEEMVGKEAR